MTFEIFLLDIISNFIKDIKTHQRFMVVPWPRFRI